MTARFEPDSREKRSGRVPEGPAHARKGSLGQTLKRTFAEFKEDELTDRAAATPTISMIPALPLLLVMLSIGPLNVSTADAGPAELTTSVRAFVIRAGSKTSPTIETSAISAGKIESTP